MALFEFSLKPLNAVTPWGDHLHWFGLTDGTYHINVGEEQLFRYSRQILQHWKIQYPALDINQIDVDYQVVRLYEDLLDILPNVLQPIPTELQNLITTSSTESVWWKRCGRIFDASENDTTEDIFYLATEWWSVRHLSTMHLKNGPRIALWLYEDVVHIRWNNQHGYVDDIPVWTSQIGEHRIPLGVFLQEVKTFHERLMSSMQNRVRTIVHDNPIPQVKIDIEKLVQEQDERERSLDSALIQPPRIADWNAVIFAVRELENRSD